MLPRADDCQRRLLVSPSHRKYAQMQIKQTYISRIQLMLRLEAADLRVDQLTKNVGQKTLRSRSKLTNANVPKGGPHEPTELQRTNLQKMVPLEG